MNVTKLKLTNALKFEGSAEQESARPEGNCIW